MEEQFHITITVINENDGPLLKFSSKGGEVRTAEFGVLCGVFKDLTAAALEAHLQVATHLSALASKTSQCVCQEDEDEDEDEE